jgi:hypothetical protein
MVLATCRRNRLDFEFELYQVYIVWNMETFLLVTHFIKSI